MKRYNFFIFRFLTLLVVCFFFSVTLYPQTISNSFHPVKKENNFNANKNNRVLKKMQREAAAIQKEGGMTAIGVSVCNIPQLSAGRQKAYLNAVTDLAHQLNIMLKPSVPGESELSNKKGNSSFVIMESHVFMKGAKIIETRYLETRSQKKSGWATCYVLVIISKENLVKMNKIKAKILTNHDYNNFKKTFKKAIHKQKDI